MAEVGVSVVAKLAEYLVDPTLKQLRYLFCVTKIPRDVEITKEKLMLQKGRVQERVEEAINRTERIDAEVDKWKDDVESLIAEVQTLEEQLRANNGCLRGWCPTWTRYSLCKKLAKTTQRMVHLTAKSDHFNPFSHPVNVPGIEYHSSKDFMFFKSTKKAHDELWEILQNDDSYMIGLWGMGGLGKTTLVKEVGKKAKESKLFDQVIITTVSQTPNIRKIQGEIADLLGLKLEEETEVGRARRIAMRLQSPKERILIILDDVWAMLNLEDIGNPFGDEGHPRNCKVLLTTRRQEVCTLMECQQIIQLDLLKEDEAWTLFQTHANIGDATKEKLARDIAMECKGLPIAIVAVGTCLKGKGIDQMKVMLSRLRNAKPINVDKGVRDVFACLQLSYDYLSTPEAKQLLLMCAMFPEDHNIDVEDLFRYGVGLGLCRDADSFEIARSQVRTTIDDLIDSSLLMCPTKLNMHAQEFVRMHDVVRDFALWIASEQDRTIMVNSTKELNELIVDKAIKDCYSVSSWHDNNEIPQFPSRLDAPKLEFMLLCSKKTLDMSHASFEGIEGLKALIIEYIGKPRTELQLQSFQRLSNLQTLRLQHWDLCDISFVVSLTRLEILDLRGSKFERMPGGIEKLNKLRLLDLSSCMINECCYKVIGCCSQLEELYVPTHFSHSKYTNCYEYLVGPIGLMKLRRYNLGLGACGKYWRFHNKGIERLATGKDLRLGQLNISMLGAVIKDLLQRANGFDFYELEGGSNSFIPNIVQVIGGTDELTKLCLKKCSEIECIIDKTTCQEDAIASRLNELVLRDMDNLKQLCRGPSSISLFQKLERLSIFNCHQLLHIFPAGCNLVNLKFLKISTCTMLTLVFPVSTACTLLSLEELEIERCSQLKHVFGEIDGEEQPTHDQDETHIELPLLKSLKLENLPNLVRICSKRYHPMCLSIKTIQWRGCPNMELQELQYHQTRNEEYKPLSAIERIELYDCGVESIFHYQTRVEEQMTFQCLKELTLRKCARLKFLFSTPIYQSLPELTFVTISFCEELEAIFPENEETQNESIAKSCLLKLKSLRISECSKLKFIIPFMINDASSILPQLSTLTISDCSQMEEIFRCSNIEDRVIDSEREITFLDMKDMKLMNLPRLVNVCQGFKLHIREFYRVEVHNCPKLMPIKSASIECTKEGGLVRKYALRYNQLNNNEAPNLPLSVLNAGEIDIQSHRVEHWWRVIVDDEEEEGEEEEEEEMVQVGVVPTQVLSFQYLHSLKVTNNKNLKCLFSKNTVVQNSLPKLTSLTLSNCEELEEIIIAENEEHQIMANVHVRFPELRRLTVERCNKLKRLFSTSMATVVPQLYSLVIHKADQLEVIFGDINDDTNYSDTIVLSSLNKLSLNNLPNFMSVCDQGLQIQMQLACLTIWNCPKLACSSLGWALQQQLRTTLESQELKGHELRNEEYKPLVATGWIELDNCGVESIFSYEIGVEGKIPTFQYLKKLTLRKCARLKFVFSVHMCQSLTELTYLTISCCEELEAAFLQNDEETPKNLSINESCLLKLKSLEISKCNKLKFILSFMMSATTSMLLQLSTLRISDCSEMEEIFRCSNVEAHGINNEREITFPNMKDMEIYNLPRLVRICRGYKLQTGEFCSVMVHDCPKLMPIQSATIAWSKDRLHRRYALKHRQLNNNEALNLPLSVLNVGELDLQSPNVEHEWEVSGDDDEEEEEEEMEGVGVVPTQVLSFQYLHSLQVTHCKKMKFLFSKSTLVYNSLPKLTSLTLSNCEELEVIFGDSSEEDANYDGTIIVLSSLRQIYLKNLPNLKSVCDQGLQIEMELRDFICICNCPKFVDSSLGSALQQLGTISLSQVYSIEDSNVETASSSHVNVNEEKGTMLISRAEELILQDLNNLISIWEGPTFIMFQNLRELCVSECRRLKCMFPSSVMRSLPCLEYLRISECEELEEIMMSSEEKEEELHHHFPNESSSSFCCFPNLHFLGVIRCRKLKCIFPCSLPSAPLLPQLTWLTIAECNEVKGVYDCEHEECFISNNIMLPKLRYLTIEDCPNFSKTTLAALQSLQTQNNFV